MAASLLERVARQDMPADFQSLYDATLDRAGEGGGVEVLARHPSLQRFHRDDFYALILELAVLATFLSAWPA